MMMSEEPANPAGPNNPSKPSVNAGIPPIVPSGVLGLPVKLWDTVILVFLAFAADVCLYRYPGGTGMAVLLTVSVFGLLVPRMQGLRNAQPFLMIVILLIAARSAWDWTWLLTLAGLLGLVAFSIKLHKPDWRCIEVACAAVPTMLLGPFRAWGHLIRRVRPAGSTGQGVDCTGEMRPRVVLVPLSVIILFTLIFIAANPVAEEFARKTIDRLADWIAWLEDIITVGRVFWWMLWLAVFAALIRPVTTSSVAGFLTKQTEQLQAAPPQAVEDNEDFTTALITLISVNALFLAFNAFDSIYLYFRAALPEGITYSEYSHRGCGWLTLALALSTIIIGILFRGKLNFHTRSRTLRLCSYVWAVQNAVLAMGALRRLQMYMEYNGLTRLRIVGIYGVLLICAGLAFMTWKVARRKNFLWLARCDTLAFIIAIVVLALTPRDFICWKYNASQAMSGNLPPLTNINVQEMSPESFPPLVPLLEHENKIVREGIAGLLGSKLQELRKTAPANFTEWQGSRAWALSRLQAASGTINDTVPPEQWKAAENKLRDFVRPWEHTPSRE